jgi:hypothetical protein
MNRIMKSDSLVKAAVVSLLAWVSLISNGYIYRIIFIGDTFLRHSGTQYIHLALFRVFPSCCTFKIAQLQHINSYSQGNYM